MLNLILNSLVLLCALYLLNAFVLYRIEPLSRAVVSTRLAAKASKASASSTVFVCESCGMEHIKWVGRCTSCGEWNSVKELRLPSTAFVSKLDSVRSGSAGSFPLSSSTSAASRSTSASLISLSAVNISSATDRIQVWSSEVGSVLGGGLVRGSVVLIAGDPGVGKSTLLLQLSASIAGAAGGGGVVYVSGEENAEQLLSRVHRLQLPSKNIFLLCDTDADNAVSRVLNLDVKPDLIIVDSVQMMRTQSGGNVGGAGSVTQIRDCAALFVELAKTSGTAVVLVGHVTKNGEVAGPRVLEHLVDTVLYLEAADGVSSCRLLRCIKNRFGATDEVGVLSMGALGLEDVSNPSEMFMSRSLVSLGAEGCAVALVLEGSRPLLAEIQCLVGAQRTYYPASADSSSPNAFPKSSKRAADGFPSQRLLLICAVIEKFIGLQLSSRDIYLNVVGGLRVSEPAADLGVAVTVV